MKTQLANTQVKILSEESHFEDISNLLARGYVRNENSTIVKLLFDKGSINLHMFSPVMLDRVICNANGCLINRRIAL